MEGINMNSSNTSEKRILAQSGSPYTWPGFPFTPSDPLTPITPINPINPLETNTNITYYAPSPTILAIEVKDKVLFYYIKDSAIYYAVYEKGKPITFTWAHDLSEIFKVIGAL